MENVHYKCTMVNKRKEKSFFQFFKRGQFLTNVYFCIIFVKKGRQVFDNYRNLSDCFKDHIPEIRAGIKDIVNFIQSVGRTSKQDAPEIQDAEIVGGRSGLSRKRKGKRRKSTTRRVNENFRGGAPPFSKVALIVCLIAIFLLALVDTDIKYPEIEDTEIEDFKSNYVKPPPEYKSLEETFQRINKDGAKNAIFLDIHAHGMNIDEYDQNIYKDLFKKKGVHKYRLEVSNQNIWHYTGSRYISSLSSGFYNYWINSNRIDNYQFSNDIDPSIEMLEEYLNSAMHTSNLKKKITFLDEEFIYPFLETRREWKVPTDYLYLQNHHLEEFYKSVFIQMEGHWKGEFEKSKSEIDPTLKKILHDDSKYALQFSKAREDPEKMIKIALDILCDKAEDLSIALDHFNYQDILDVSKIKSQYCIPNEPIPPIPWDVELAMSQKQHYRDVLDKKTPQGYGEQTFEKEYVIPVYKNSWRPIADDGHGIVIMLTTNLSDEQKEKLLKITKLNDEKNIMYEEDITGKYYDHDYENPSEPTVDVDTYDGPLTDAYRKILIDPEYIPDRKILQEDRDVTVYSFRFSNLVELLKEYGIDDIYIHDFSCDGYSNKKFKPDKDQQHMHTIKKLLGGKARTRRGGKRARVRYSRT
jgi:hypothetical protein